MLVKGVRGRHQFGEDSNYLSVINCSNHPIAVVMVCSEVINCSNHPIAVVMVCSEPLLLTRTSSARKLCLQSMFDVLKMRNMARNHTHTYYTPTQPNTPPHTTYIIYTSKCIYDKCIGLHPPMRLSILGTLGKKWLSKLSTVVKWRPQRP